MTNEFYMHLAIKEAWKNQFLTYPNPAVGCVLLDKNAQILAISAHKEAGHPHAELNAVLQALRAFEPSLNIPNEPNAAYDFILKHHKGLFKGGVAFVSLEPCSHFGKTPPCASLFATLGLKKVFVSVKETSVAARGGAEILRKMGVEVEFGLCENEGLKLLKPFLKWQKNEPFKLFKLALTLNGSALGKITRRESDIYTHKIRSKLDCLVVGGETVRRDKPTLDARLVGGKAPDICILSKHDLAEFDKEIPLFKVPNRRIFTQIPPQAKFIMFEGAERFLGLFKDEMDAFLIFHNASFKDEANVRLNLPLKTLFCGTLGEDSYGIYEL